MVPDGRPLIQPAPNLGLPPGLAHHPRMEGHPLAHGFRRSVTLESQPRTSIAYGHSPNIAFPYSSGP